MDGNSIDLIKSIGKGVYGTVYLGYDRLNLRYVAVKAIDSAASTKLDTLIPNAVENEIKIYKELTGDPCNQYIACFYGTYRATLNGRDHLMIVSEYIPGGTLSDLMKGLTWFLDPWLLWSIYEQIIAAVKYIHNIGYAHRDIKPDNILKTQDNRIKIVDFGFTCMQVCRPTPIIASQPIQSHLPYQPTQQYSQRSIMLYPQYPQFGQQPLVQYPQLSQFGQQQFYPPPQPIPPIIPYQNLFQPTMVELCDPPCRREFGTLVYEPPEYFRKTYSSIKYPEFAHDVWSMTVVFFELANGRRKFPFPVIDQHGQTLSSEAVRKNILVAPTYYSQYSVDDGRTNRFIHQILINDEKLRPNITTVQTLFQQTIREGR